jgi:hypothetical protein
MTIKELLEKEFEEEKEVIASVLKTFESEKTRKMIIYRSLLSLFTKLGMSNKINQILNKETDSSAFDGIEFYFKEEKEYRMNKDNFFLLSLGNEKFRNFRFFVKIKYEILLEGKDIGFNVLTDNIEEKIIEKILFFPVEVRKEEQEIKMATVELQSILQDLCLEGGLEDTKKTSKKLETSIMLNDKIEYMEIMHNLKSQMLNEALKIKDTIEKGKNGLHLEEHFSDSFVKSIFVIDYKPSIAKEIIEVIKKKIDEINNQFKLDSIIPVYRISLRNRKNSLESEIGYFLTKSFDARKNIFNLRIEIDSLEELERLEKVEWDKLIAKHLISTITKFHSGEVSILNIVQLFTDEKDSPLIGKLNGFLFLNSDLKHPANCNFDSEFDNFFKKIIYPNKVDGYENVEEFTTILKELLKPIREKE